MLCWGKYQGNIEGYIVYILLRLKKYRKRRILRWFGVIIVALRIPSNMLCKIRKKPLLKSELFCQNILNFFSKHDYTFWRSSFSYGWDNLGGFCNSRRHVCDDVTSCLFCKIERDHLTGFIWEFMVFLVILYKADKQNTPSNKKYIFLITWFTLFVLETLQRFWVKTKEVYNLILSI